MATSAYPILALSSLLFFSFSWGILGSAHGNFLHCLSLNSQTTIPISQFVYAPSSANYTTILLSSIKNLRFLTSPKAKPRFIITPTHESHVQAAVVCSKKYNLQIRVRSGGHDFEGLSFICDFPFIIIDLVNYRSITVDIEDNSAWVQAGATIGEVFYRIAEKSKVHGFPAAFGLSTGVGGLFSGGGFGPMMRKYGLAVDHIVDAYMVDVNGNILNRESMGEDLFWAIRGGGGASYGVILSFKIRLVSVPPTVTVFKIDKTLEQGATDLVHRWQYVTDKFDKDLFIMILALVNSTNNLKVQFECLFFGGVDRLLPLMEQSFPELGVQRKDCIEMSWVESTIYLIRFSLVETLDVLLDRSLLKSYFKAKSDYVQKPIPKVGLEGIWKRMLEGETNSLGFLPYGGRMSEISESETPFPHRAGNIYQFLSTSNWTAQEGSEQVQKRIDGNRRFHEYLTPYVSKNPREAYSNHRDLDLGTNIYGKTSYAKALVWGKMYFKNNFKRLAIVKKKVDPDNFFWNEQSIPPYPY